MRRGKGAFRGSDDFRSKMIERDVNERGAKLAAKRARHEKAVLARLEERTLNPGNPEADS